MATQVDTQVPGKATTSNEMFFDALVRHQIGLLRLSGSIRNDIIAILDASEADIADKIRKILEKSKGLTQPSDVNRLNTLLKAIKASRLQALKDVSSLWVKEMKDLAVAEPLFIDGAVKTVAPVTLATVIPPVPQLKQIVTSKPFEGKVLKEWADQLTTADLNRIEAQIKIGLVQGESSQEIARRVVGTKLTQGRDGVTEITRRNAEGITRTAVNAISNHAKRAYYEHNDGIFSEELYVATLDARTTLVCKSLDGQTFPIAEGPIPPLHFNCRSLRVAIISNVAMGERPAKPVTNQQLLREYTAENNLPSVSSRSALPRGHKGAYDGFARMRIREMTGTVPAKVSYQKWLERQSAAFQDDTLGVTRGALFRRGDLPLTKFVNRAGDEIPLSQLARKERQAFIDAGLDPESFL